MIEKKLMGDKGYSSKYPTQLIWIGAISVFLVVLFLYTPALKNDFVNWDDDACIYENIHIRSLDIKSLRWMFTSFHVGNWHPLTWLSHALVYSLWELDPRMHHLINIILHAINTLLVFFLSIKLMSLWRATADHMSSAKADISTLPQDLMVASTTALLFGLHPLSVESVAWVTERKGLLSAFFALLSILSYLTYASTIHRKHRSIWFGTSLLLFLFALMSKPIAVTLPVTLILLDIYPLKRINLYPDKTDKKLTVFLEKIPFFSLSIVSSIVTVMAQQSGGAIKGLEEFYLDERLLNAIRSLAFYLGKMIIPLKLVPFYPLPTHIQWLDSQCLLSALLLSAITGGCIWMVKRGRYLFLIVWLYYVITLFPTLSIIQIGGHAAADRHTYLPGLSIFLLSGIGASLIFKRIPRMRFKAGLLLGFICIVLLILGQLTIRQIRVWQNSEVLWNYVVSVFPKSAAIAHFNLGAAYFDHEKIDESMVEYKRALLIEPDYAEVYYGLGAAYFRQGKIDKAMVEYKRALSIKPDYAEAHDLLGVAYAKKGNLKEAIMEHKKSLTINPSYAIGFSNLGFAYAEKGDLDDAIISYEKALSINPHMEATFYNLGLVYYKKGILDKAVLSFLRALELNPSYAKACYSLGLAYYYKRNYKLAIVNFDKAAELGYGVNPELMEFLKPYR